MPRMGGEDLIRAVRAERPGLPVVVVTGSAPLGGAEALRRYAGGHGPLLLRLKPPNYEDLACGGATGGRGVRRHAREPPIPTPTPDTVPSLELAD